MTARTAAAAGLLLGMIAASGTTAPLRGPLAQPPDDKAKAPPAAPVAPEIQKGRELFQAGKFDDAVEEFRKAGKANAQLPPPRVMLAELFLAANQGAAARQTIERAAAEDADHPAVYLMNAFFASNEGRVTETILNCAAALKATDSPRWSAEQRARYARDARLGLATGYEQRRDFAAAKEHVAALLAAEPKNAQLRSRLAVALFMTGKAEEAAAEFTTAAKDDVTADPPELQMARMWTARQDAAKSEEWMKKAAAAHGKNAKVVREYAGWLLNLGRLDEAAPQVDAAAALDPTAPAASALRGLLHRYKREMPQAEAAFEKLNRDSPADRFAAGNLALVLAETGDAAKQKRAIELAENLVRQNQKSGDGYAVLGWCYFKSGRLDDAYKALATAASGGAVERDTAYYLAQVLYAQNKPDDARKVLKEAVAATGAFVNKPAAVALQAEIDAKHPPKPTEKK